MIGWLNGTIVDKQEPGKLVLNVNGVGYDVETSMQTFFQLTSLEQEIGLHIHTVVREDALKLYGFLEFEERALFRALIKVNGVGPKSAIAILSSISPHEFIQCIHQQETGRLEKLPGIGKKTAQRLVVEMKDSLDSAGFEGTTAPAVIPTHGGPQEEARKALEALGYRAGEVQKALKGLEKDGMTAEDLIRKALQNLSSR